MNTATRREIKRRTRRPTNTTPHIDDEITKKHKRKNLIYVKTTYLN